MFWMLARVVVLWPPASEWTIVVMLMDGAMVMVVNRVKPANQCRDIVVWFSPSHYRSSSCRCRQGGGSDGCPRPGVQRRLLRRTVPQVRMVRGCLRPRAGHQPQSHARAAVLPGRRPTGTGAGAWVRRTCRSLLTAACWFRLERGWVELR